MSGKRLRKSSSSRFISAIRGGKAPRVVHDVGVCEEAKISPEHNAAPFCMALHFPEPAGDSSRVVNHVDVRIGIRRPIGNGTRFGRWNGH